MTALPEVSTWADMLTQLAAGVTEMRLMDTLDVPTGNVTLPAVSIMFHVAPHVDTPFIVSAGTSFDGNGAHFECEGRDTVGLGAALLRNRVRKQEQERG